jgi:peptidoglycan/LPS O-acetylase OafA/YrhL
VGRISLRHLPELDGIRGVAIVWVVFHNATDRVAGPAHGLSYLLMLFAHTGWIGVQLFFALSGFLITAGLLATQHAPRYFRDFYARRALRILPLYYAVLVALLVICPRFAAATPLQGEHQLPLWLFTANLGQALPLGFAHFWSLSVEEQFYLLWPLVVGWLPPKRLLPACAAIALGALLVRAAMSVAGADSWTIYSNTACRMDALALGGAGACLLYLSAARAWFVRHLRLLMTVTMLLFILGIPVTHVYSTTDFVGQTLGYALLALCAAVFVTVIAVGGAGRVTHLRRLLAAAPLRSLGKYSYAIYVFHNLLHRLWGDPWLVAHFGPQPAPAIVLAYALAVLFASYVLALCSYQLLEKHFLRLKRHFDARPTPVAAGAS